MKNSGIEWIGNIPDKWGVVILSSIAKERKAKNNGLVEKNLLSLSYGKIKRKNIDTNDGLLPASFDGYNIIEEGDIVLRLTDLQNDHTSLRTGLCKEKGIITSAYTTIIPQMDYIIPSFLHYYLHAFDNCKGFYGMGAGVRQGLNWDEVRKILVLLPTINEQLKITAFLDKKLTEIDSLIVIEDKQIEKLKKYKQAVITEAVTKGLDPTAPMKDSGIYWIGTIPQRWEVIRLKHLYDYSNGSPVRVGPFGSALPSSEIINEGVWVYNQRTVLDHNFTTNNIFVSNEKAKELESFSVFPKDILITTRGSIGKTAIVPDNAPEGILHPCVIRFRIDRKKILDNLLSTIFNETNICIGQIMDMSNSTTIEVLYSYSLKEIWVPLPPIEEQAIILQKVNEYIKTFDKLVFIKQKKINDLIEYKKSIIYEYVTGKKEVI